MRNFILSLVFIPTFALAQGFRGQPDTYDAIQKGQELSYLLQNLSGVAGDEAATARRYGDYVSARDLQVASGQANRLSALVENTVVRPLHNRGGERVAERNFAALGNDFQSLYQTVQRVRNVTHQVRQLLGQVRQAEFALGRILNDLCNDDGGGYGREFVGNCRVVLETVWGQDLSSFYGQAAARNPQTARSLAEQQGRQQCERARRGLQKCTVDVNNCTATPSRRF